METWKKWVLARNKLVADNHFLLNINEGLEMAKEIDNFEAKTICKWFPTGKATIKEFLKVLKRKITENVFDEEKGIAMSFYACFLPENKRKYHMKKSADLGNSYGEAKYGGITSDLDEKYYYWSKAAEKYEPLALTYLCEYKTIPLETRILYAKTASELDYSYAKILYSNFFDDLSFEKYYWMIRFHNINFYIEKRIIFVFEHQDNLILRKAAYEMGRYLQLNIDKFKMFHEHKGKDKDVIPKLLQNYNTIYKRSKEILDTWTLCAKRMGICKDMRFYISKTFWDIKTDF